MTTELLPGEDPALLPGPDRVELYPVLEIHDLNPVQGSSISTLPRYACARFA